jgi:mandelate racemase
MQAATALEEIGVFWLEKPVHAEDLFGSAGIAAAIATPVAVGESLFGPASFSEVVRARAADAVMVDLQHCAGVTGFMRSAALVEEAHIAVSSHLFTEVSIHLLGARPSSLILEACFGASSGATPSKRHGVDGWLVISMKPVLRGIRQAEVTVGEKVNAGVDHQ